MKILVSTKATQGFRQSDFCWLPEGEWLHFTFICDTDMKLMKRKRFDGGCGCGRSLAGLVSGKATTTFRVVDLPITTDEYAAKIREDNEREGGWNLSEEYIARETLDLIRIAEQFHENQILEKRGHEIVVRKYLPICANAPAMRR